MGVPRCSRQRSSTSTTNISVKAIYPSYKCTGGELPETAIAEQPTVLLPGTNLAGVVELTLTLQKCAEEKRARVRQMWPRTVSGRSKRT